MYVTFYVSNIIRFNHYTYTWAGLSGGYNYIVKVLCVAWLILPYSANHHWSMWADPCMTVLGENLIVGWLLVLSVMM